VRAPQRVALSIRFVFNRLVEFFEFSLLQSRHVYLTHKKTSITETMRRLGCCAATRQVFGNRNTCFATVCVPKRYTTISHTLAFDFTGVVFIAPNRKVSGASSFASVPLCASSSVVIRWVTKYPCMYFVPWLLHGVSNKYRILPRNICVIYRFVVYSPSAISLHFTNRFRKSSVYGICCMLSF